MDGFGWARIATGRTAFAVRLALFYGALFVMYGVHVPYLPVWLDWQGLSAREIAVVTATPYFLRLLVTPSVALAADRLGNHRIMVIALSWTALALVLVLSGVTGFWLLFLVAVPFAITINTMLPLTETIAVGGVIAYGLDYGRMRLWGSLTFIAVGLLGGTLVDSLGAGVAIWLIVVGAIATVAAGHYLPPPTPEQDTASRPHPKLAVAAARRLVAHPLFLLFLVAAGSIQAAHAMFYAFGALNWRAQGLSTSWVGVLWAIAVLSEVVLFAYSGAVVRRVGAAGLLVGGGAAAIVRWGAMAFELPLAALAPLQVLHAATYGASHLGAIHFIARAVPTEAAGTAQALYATVAAGVMMGAATMASGSLYAVFGGRAYLAMAALGAVGLAASVVVIRRWDGGPLWSRAGEEVR